MAMIVDIGKCALGAVLRNLHFGTSGMNVKCARVSAHACVCVCRWSGCRKFHLF